MKQPWVEWALTTKNVANIYYARIHGERAGNLERAIALFEQALAVQTRDAMPVEWALTTMNLANAYYTRIGGERAQNIERAIALHEQALQVLTRTAMPIEWAQTTQNLASAYYTRIGGERTENIERAIALYEQALQVLTHTAMPIEWAQTTQNLANAYADRLQGERTENTKRAITLYNQALEVFTPTTLPALCRMVAHNLGNICFNQKRWQQAGEAYAEALQAVETLYQTALSRSGKNDALVESTNLYRRAAYALARVDDLRGAVVTLESGRAHHLSEVLARDRANLTRVQQEYPALYDQYVDAAARMRQFEAAERGALQVISTTSFLLPSNLRDAAEHARTDLDISITRIRTIPGYAEFLTTPGWDDIAVAVEPIQPLVYLLTTSEGSMALIIHRTDPSAGPLITPVWLDNFTDVQLQDLLVGTASGSLLGGWLGAYVHRGADWQGWLTTIDQVTHQLWDAVMRPVLAQLQLIGANQAIIVPTGLLPLLPLHAAWAMEGDQRIYALDQLTLSYTPSARVLTYARQTAATIPVRQLLAVDEPLPVHASSLLSAQAEVNAIADLFDMPIVFRHTGATRQVILDALPQVQVAHFACHGGIHWDDPLQSGLLLANDEVLTVQDLFALHLNGARLATLSACETGIVGIRLPDEVAALPAAFIRAGFAGVAASLWSVADLSTAMLMTRFYQLWRSKGLEPPEALRQAQIWLRDTTNGQKQQYFQQFLPEFSSESHSTRLPASVADVLYKVLALADDDVRSFAHPFHWAAFQYVGV
jgi:CHAT domain-containing protein/tetratricopeptide (TPR) repeat protein